jgi:FdhE protein
MSLSAQLRQIHRVIREARVDVPPIRVDPGTAQRHLQAGQPVLAGMSVPVDEAAARRILDGICRIVATPPARRLQALMREQPISFQAVADALLLGREGALTEEAGIPQTFLFFVVMAGLRPSLRRHALHLQSLLQDLSWHRASCPICGSVPSLAELRGEPGRRYLRCSLCEAAWRVPRLRCPFCATTDYQKLRYLRIEGEPEMRLDFCDACGRYLKTRILPGGDEEPDPFARDLETIHLDALAREKGYRGPWPEPG